MRERERRGMKLEEFDLGKLLEFRPTEGKLLLQQDRMLLFRQAAMAFLRRLLYEQVGERLARSLLMQFGYRCGFGEFGALNRAHEWETENERLGIGPVMHTWEGIVHV